MSISTHDTTKCKQCGRSYYYSSNYRTNCPKCGLHYCGRCKTWMTKKDFIGEGQNLGTKCYDCRKKARFSPGWLKLRFEVLKRDNFTCQYCGRSAPDVPLAVDHIFPFSKGGKHTMENLKTACEDCNIGKGDSVL